MPDNPRFDRACRRRAVRYRPSHGDTATVRLELVEGSVWTLNVVEISENGLAFGLDHGRPPLTVGARIDRATIRLGSEQIAGSLCIRHVTEEFAAGTICGAEFTPSSVAEERIIEKVLEVLAARDRHPD